MFRSALIALVAAALGTAGWDDAWARGGGKSGSGSSGRACSNLHRHSNSMVPPPIIASGTHAGGYYRGYYSPYPSGATEYRYYCPEFDRYYPEVLECPSGFRGVTY